MTNSLVARRCTDAAIDVSVMKRFGFRFNLHRLRCTSNKPIVTDRHCKPSQDHKSTSCPNVPNQYLSLLLDSRRLRFDFEFVSLYVYSLQGPLDGE